MPSTTFGYTSGNEHQILNVTINDSNAGNDYLGLFGAIQAQVKNLGIESITILAGDDTDGVGGLCGYNDGTISGCYAVASVSGHYGLGGLCGENSGAIINCCATGSVTGYGILGGLCGRSFGLISNCYATGSVTGGADSWPLGGLVGENFIGTISNCYATGSVSRHSGGGLCGWNREGTISGCYATGSVTGGHGLGGLCGGNQDGAIIVCYATGLVCGNDYVGGLSGSNSGAISYCYSTGSVDGNEYVGGLVGVNASTDEDEKAEIINSYWDIQASNEPNMCGSQYYGTGCDPNYGKTTAEMHQQSTFKGSPYLYCRLDPRTGSMICTRVYWDFINVWNIGENQTYPYLRTVPAGDINKDETVNFLDLCIIAQQWCNEQ